MSCYRVFCEACEAEYHITSVSEDLKDPPVTCSFCGTDLDESNVNDESEEYGEDWERLVDDELDNLDDWKD